MKILKYIIAFIWLFTPLISWADSGTFDDTGTNYYIDKTNGSNSNNGLSGDYEGDNVGPWESLSEFVDLAPGSDVFLLCGETWTAEQISVNFGGVSTSNYTVIGAYYMDGATETIGVNGDGKPIIRGITSPPTEAGQYKQYDGLIEAESKQDYVYVENISLKNSGGYGVHGDDGPTNWVVRYCDFESMWDQSIWLDQSTNSVIEYNTFQDTGREYLLGEGGWPGCVAMGSGTKAAQGATIMHNTFNGTYGEAIGPGDNSEVAYNLIIDTRSKGIYINAIQNANIHHNLIIGTNDTTYQYQASPSYHNAGIAINIENAQNAEVTGCKIHNNIVINTLAGIQVNNSKNDPSYPIQDNEYINNTFIDNLHNVYILNASDNLNTTGNVYKNNLHYANHSDSNNVTIVSNDIDNWDADYNSWYNANNATGYDDSETGLKGAYDVGADDNTHDPGFAKATWRGTTTLNNNTFTIEDLTPTANTIDAGVDLGTSYDDAFLSSSAKPPNSTTTSDQDNYDAWDIGAVISGFIISDQYPTSQQSCGCSGEMGVTSSSNANCKYSEKGTDTCSTAYADLDTAFMTGQGTTSHSTIVDNTCDTSTTYVVKCEDNDMGLISNCLEITMDIADSEGEPPQPAPGTIIGGGDMLIVGDGNVLIH